MKKIELIIIILAICGVILFAGSQISFEKTITVNNTTNNTTNNTNMTNLTNNTTINVEKIDNNYDSSNNGKSDSREVPSDIYSRWDTDGDGIISKSEMDVHDKSLGQGDYYTGHENMKDSFTTYPDTTS